MQRLTSLPDSSNSKFKGWWCSSRLVIAAGTGRPYLFHFLIERGSDPTLKDNRGWRLLHFAAAGGSDDIIERLLHVSVRFVSYLRNNNGLTSLITAVPFRWPDSLLFQIIRGTDPTCTLKDKHDLSLLYLDVDLPDSNGRTPLMIAAITGQPYLFHFLIARGLDHTLKDNHGWSLLHFAAAGGSNGIIEKLLLLGLDIDSRDTKGRTPLMTAAFSNQLESFLFLIEKGSNLLLKDNSGWGVLLWATLGLGKDITEKLLSPSFTPFQKFQTAIIMAISKYNESSSMIFARDVDKIDSAGYGQLFQLKNENGFMWENGRVRAEELQFGSVVIYWDNGDLERCEFTYWCKAPKEPQVVGNSFQYFLRLKSLMGHYNHSLSVNATIMVSTNCPIIGEQVDVNFVAQ